MADKGTTFSPKQLRVLTWWQDPRWEAVICDGAVRSGKTFAMGVGFFLWAQARFDGRQFGLCGKTIASVRRNLLAELTPYLRRLGMDVRERRGEHALTVRFRGHENRFLLFGGRDESSAALIQGSTLAGVLLDEAALMPRSFVEQACARCSVSGSKVWLSCNPEGPGHWFYREWVEKAEEKRICYLHFTMEDNPALSPETREKYRRLFRGNFYQRFVLGEWCAPEGLVYPFFDGKGMPEAPADCQEWRVSCDYGTVNPASFGLWGRKDGVWYRTAEYYFDSKTEGRQKTDGEYTEDLLRLAGGRELAEVVVDPSAASFIEVLRRRGFRVVRADNDVADGIRVTADLLREGRIVLCRGCRDCLREIGQYCWEQRGERDAPRKKDDHAMDDLRYFAMDLAGDREEEGFTALAVERPDISLERRWGL